MKFANYRSFSGYRKEGGGSEYYTSMYVKIKEDIINKSLTLNEAFCQYYKICIMRGKKSRAKELAWHTALLELYQEVKEKLKDSSPVEKRIKEKMELIIMQKRSFKFEEAYEITASLQKWLEESGLKKIAIESIDWEKELDIEDSDDFS